MPKLNSRLTDEQRQHISDGMLKFHARRKRYTKLSDEQVEQIKDLYDSRTMRVQDLADAFQISVKHLYKVLKG